MMENEVEFVLADELYKLFNGLSGLDNSVYLGIPILLIALYFSVRSILDPQGMLTFQGRAGHREYTITYIGTSFACVFCSIVAVMFLQGKHYIYSAICVYITGFFFVYSYAITVKRLHDLNLSGWIAFVQLGADFILSQLPYQYISHFVWIIFTVFLMVKKGSIGVNKYGDEGHNSSDNQSGDGAETMAQLFSVKGLILVNGRRSRFPYFLLMISVDILYYAVDYIRNGSHMAIYSYIFALLFYISFCNTAKRFQDLNASFWPCILYMFVGKFMNLDAALALRWPINEVFYSLVGIILTFQPGTKGANKYGASSYSAVKE